MLLTSLRDSLRNLAHYALDFFLPRLCLFCGEAVEPQAAAPLCPACEARVVRVQSPLCPRCGRLFLNRAGSDRPCGFCLKEPPPFAAARAAVVYEEDGLTGRAIKQFKYHRRLEYLPLLRHWLTEPACLKFAAPCDLIVPVPLHRRRLQERGFNQALLLARGLPGRVLRHTLVRTRHTQPQTGLNPRARRENVRRAFAVRGPEAVHGQSVLLVDDVYTTGATVRECSRALLAAGAREVRVLTVARVAPPGFRAG
jgi:ComF family protein